MAVSLKLPPKSEKLRSDKDRKLKDLSLNYGIKIH